MNSNGFVSAAWFTRATYSTTAIVIAVATAFTWRHYPMGAKGLLVGGAAALLGFWMLSRRAAMLPSIPKAEIPFRVYRWTFGRMLVYAAALIWAYSIDPRNNHALIGATAGLFLARAAMIAVGIVAWRRAGVR